MTSKLEPHEVNYSPDMPDAAKSSIERILTHKSTYWQYENEVRFFKNEITSNNNKAHPWLSVKINRIYLGYRMSKTDVTFYTSLIHSILGDGVEVHQMKREELDTGLR